MRMQRSLSHTQHGGKADIRSFHHLAPLLTRAGRKDAFKLLTHRRPARGVTLLRLVNIAQTGLLNQQSVKLWLD
jgi:hypothetical protein